jgi:hypothetical protein
VYAFVVHVWFSHLSMHAVCRAASTFTKEAYFSGTCTTHACVSIANAAGTVRCPVAGVLRVRVRACVSLTAVLLAVLMARADGRY